MSAETFFLLFVVPPFVVSSLLALVSALLTRSILSILREIAPEREAELAAHTGVPIIDNMFWVRPFKFAAFARANPPFEDARLARRLAQYKRARQLSIGVAVYFGLLTAVLFILFMR